MNISWPEIFLNLKPEQLEIDKKIDVEKFKQYGMSIWRNFLDQGELEILKNAAKRAKSRPFHPVARDLSVDDQIELLSPQIRRKLVTALSPLLGHQLGLTGVRFLIKEKGDTGAVKLHQDVGYHVGHFDQLSIFVSLNGMNAQNGGLRLIAGSQHLGYLGDAGQLNQFHPVEAEVAPELDAGDAIIMHCATTHYSPINHSDEPRELFEILLCHADQPWRIDTCTDNKKNSSPFSDINAKDYELFRSSRVQRLEQLRQDLERHKHAAQADD